MRHKRVLLTAAIAAGTMWASSSARAASGDYQTAVLADNPFVYYRQNDAGPLSTGSVAADATLAHNGSYQGTPTAGVAGSGTSSDNAVAYDGTDNEFLAAPINGFGSLVGSSSYEFLFKVNAGAPTSIQSLFGVYTKAANLPDVNIDLNSNGNDAGAANNVPGNTRLFIRGNNADANGGASVAGHFTNPGLYDGNYHHLVFTFDSSTVDPDTDGAGPDLGGGGFGAYVDGIPQAITFTQVNGTVAPAGFSDFDVLAGIAARNVRVDPLTTAGVTREANVTLDEVALYGTILTPEQVASHAAAAGIPEPGTLALLGAATGFGMLRRRRA